jgi:hypothetical protein
MPKLNPQLLAAIWARAETEEIGISIETTDPVLLRHRLLEVRQSTGDHEDLMTFIPEGQKAVFIVRKTVELPDVTT